ncbi:hypothetical protein [Desertimonas flava]|uniref:hypothetical protein n=1 Tax=Desertimonas flava TaxID=2064846 RepID=UPI000E34DEB0|nr:hypothetical protein [Desertimonas flava]
MTKVVVHRERFSDAVRGGTEPTADDVTILRDGRRLDSAEKVRAFVAEFDAELARRRRIDADRERDPGRR